MVIGEVAVITMVIGLLLVALMFVAQRRQRTVSVTVVASALLAIGLEIARSLLASGLVPDQVFWAKPWVEVAAYSGVAWFLLLALDGLVIGEVLIDRKGRYIPDLVRTLTIGAALVGAVLVVLRLVMDLDVVALVALPTIATAVIGVALKDTLARLFAGIELGRSVKVGDWVRAAGHEGVVTDIGLEHVTLVTREQIQVSLPNDGIIRDGLVNYSRPTPTHLCVVDVEASYEAPPALVCQTLIDAAQAVQGVLTIPDPSAHVRSFNESGILYRLKFPIGDFAFAAQMESAVRTYVWNAFARKGIEFPFPQRVVHTKPHAPSRNDQEELDQVLRSLTHVDFLGALDPKQLEHLARASRVEQYLPGERIVRQGAEGHECYIILSGKAEVRVEESGRSSSLTQLEEGRFFGELSLLTGEPRAATVVALTPLKVIVIGKEALLTVVQEDRALVDRISEVVAQRQASIVAAKEQLSRDAQAARLTSQKRSLIARIQHYLWGMGTARRG